MKFSGGVVAASTSCRSYKDYQQRYVREEKVGEDSRETLHMYDGCLAYTAIKLRMF